jgi:uncharacterized protein YutE (UPF0331/DUF86 family)
MTGISRRWSNVTFNLAIEVVISVSEQMIVSLSLPTPGNSKAVGGALADAGVITSELASHLEQTVGFRNVNVHQYMDIDYNRVYDALHNDLDDIEAFLAAISTFLLAQP